MRALLVLTLVLLTAAPARAGVDLRAVAPLGQARSDTAALAAAGDVNGDGVPDLAAGLDLRGEAVVTFSGGAPDPGQAGFSGLVITHLNAPVPRDGYSVGGDVAGVGDWDGDGLADVAFGAIGAAPGRREDAGSVYVVLGRREPGTIDVRTDPRVIRIDGPARHALAGDRLGAVGDVDGDGRPDLAIAVPGERAYVVRGGSGPRIDLAHPPAGSTIALDGLGAGAGTSFAPAGDVNRDGRGDLLVGAPAANPLRGRGRVYVLPGAPGGAVVHASTSRIAVVLAPKGLIGFGGSVAALPDADGDGEPEWIAGTPLPAGAFAAVGGGGPPSFDVFVVFSRARGEIHPDRPGQPVATLTVRGALAGGAVAGVPDITGDGVPDVLTGLPDANPSCRDRAGAVVLVPGRASPGRGRASAVRVDGAAVGGAIGTSLVVAGGDLVLGARPFENAGSLDLWRVPLSGLTTPSPALPARCLTVKLAERRRSQIHGPVHVSVRSDAGGPHRVRLHVTIIGRDTFRQGRVKTLHLAGAGRRRTTVALPRGATALLRAKQLEVFVEAEQVVGSGIRATRGALAGDGFRT